MTTETRDEQLEALLHYLRDSRGFDFTGYKRTTLTRRIQKRIEQLHLDGFAAYQDHLQVDPEEFTTLFNFILINVTSFFRDEAIWSYVRQEIIPRVLDQKRPDDPIRIWVPGCASGEEAYTLCMLLAEAMGTERFMAHAKIYATDVDEQALEQARQGVYDADKTKDVPPELASAFLSTDRTGQQVFDRELRRNVVFGRHDLVQDAPISKIDVLSCRNTLMYFNADVQAKILSSFRFALNPAGFLILGKAEMLFTRVRSFAPVDLKRRVFAVAKDGGEDGFPSAPRAMDPGDPDETAQRAAAFEASPVPQLLVTLDGRLSEANAAARSLLRMSRTELGRPISDLELAYQPIELRSRIEEAHRTASVVTVPAVEWKAADGQPIKVDVRIIPALSRDGSVLGMSVVLEDVTRFLELEEELQTSQHELETALEELQSTNEELETTNEELQSTNEELETTNEELQSTNEELETMNEELQSTNEELETVNEEARQRTDDLSDVNRFLASVLSSLRGAVIVVSRDLRVEVWNAEATEQWGLRADEAVGQHFSSLDVGLPVLDLVEAVKEALRGDRPQIEVDATSRRGRAMRCRASMAPLSDANGEITGAIVQVEEVVED